MKRMKLLFTLAIPVLLCQNTQAQSSSRLMAEAHWTNNGAMFTPADSTSYSYTSDARGGDLKHTLKYDNATTWDYVGDTAYINAWAYSQTFDANNNITSITSEYWSGTSWVLNTKTLYTYNTGNQVLTMIMQTWNGTSWAPVSEDVYTYNTGGKLQSDTYETWGLAGFTAVSEKIYSYDLTNNFLINETDENLPGGSPVYTNQYAYTYDSTTNELLTNTFSTWSGSAWVANTMVTNTYDTAKNLITILNQTYDPILARWNNVTFALLSNFTSPGSNLPQTEIDQVWDNTGSGAWVNTMQNTYTYNSSNQLTSSIGESWNVVGLFEFQNGDPMARYYYGPFGITAVKNISNTNGEANIYPVPTQNMLHIDLKWNVAQSATIAIYDVAGRMVTPQIDVPNGTEYRGGLSVNNLADGIYEVKINGTQGQIVKQIVVSH